MRNKMFILFIGFSFIWIGVDFVKHGWDNLYKFPVPKSTGVLIIVIGLLIILYGLFQKIKLNKPKDQFLICPQCLTPFDQKAVSYNKQCPICKVNLEKLMGFYERHPELKEENRKTTTITNI